MAEFRLSSPSSVSLSQETKIGEDACIEPNNTLLGNCVIGKGARICPNNILRDCIVGDGATVTSSVCEQSQIGGGTQVGPFAHLRPGSRVGERCRVGNFVEIKNSTIGNGTKIGHLTYVGDAQIGENCNLGCGVVFCNYDGKSKHRSVIGDNCFIGSNVNIVAPVSIGENSFIAAGTTVTRDIPPDSFVIGRANQQVRKRRNSENDETKSFKTAENSAIGIVENCSAKVDLKGVNGTLRGSNGTFRSNFEDSAGECRHCGACVHCECHSENGETRHE